MIQIERLQRELELRKSQVAVLKVQLGIVCDELEYEIDAKYRMGKGQAELSPIEQRRYLRDMKPVSEARRYIETIDKSDREEGVESIG